MKKFYILSTCKTCQRIRTEIDVDHTDVEVQDIKTESIQATELDAMAKISGSYESLFSKRSMQYRKLGLHEMELTEQDYRKYILEHYSFLKRPVLFIDGQVAAGNSKASVAQMQSMLDEL